MKDDQFSHSHRQEPVRAARQATAAEMNGKSVNFTPSTDEVARRAYFAYVNEGSLPGQDVQHWLEAEKQLLAERDLTRVHAFHNRT